MAGFGGAGSSARGLGGGGGGKRLAPVGAARGGGVVAGSGLTRIKLNEERWYTRLGELEAFKEEHGHCNVPRGWKENPALGRWVNKQRQARKRGELREDREAILDALGLEWELVVQVEWEERFGELEAFKEEHGHCNVPVGWEENPALGKWVAWQRQARKRGELMEEREAMLDAVGLEWELVVEWEERLGELEAFKEAHGHCNVPQGRTENPALGKWVAWQRQARKLGELREEREAMLDAVGLEWERVVEWEERFGELEAFKEAHGHCNVPQRWTENPALATWVGRQRQARKRGELGKDREAMLDALGLEWELVVQVEWEERLGELEAFKEEHGHCNVPMRRKENPALAEWVSTQRKARKADVLDEEQVARLDAIGFEWVLVEHVPPWERRYRELEAFKERFGHCDVPEGWEENPVLATWVGRQRRYRRMSDGRRRGLSDERRGRLEALGLSWEGYETAVVHRPAGGREGRRVT